MIQRRRRRRSAADAKRRKALIRKAVAWGLLAIVVLHFGKKTLEFFGVGNAVRNSAAVLQIEDLGVVNVSVEGGPLRRAENELKLYAGDTVVTSPKNFASLVFFDGTSVRLDESTQINITESERGQKRSKIIVELAEGNAWVETPEPNVFTGAIVRSVNTAYLSVNLPTNTEMVLAPRSLSVFAADGLGANVSVAGSDQEVIIGEGQRFTLTVGGESEPDLYALRSPLDPQQLLSNFVQTSRKQKDAKKLAVLEEQVASPTPVAPTTPTSPLTVVAPTDGQTVEASTVKVSGSIGSAVAKVRINGYLSGIDTETGTFSQELALPDEDEVTITIEAVDSEGTVLSQAIRTVQRDREPPEPPTIDAPATTGQSYSTNQRKLEISGKAPEGAIGILVNDYRLQLFKPGDTTWSYLANVDFNNYQIGENVFEVVAINKGGYKSDPAVLTVILGDQIPAVVEEDDTTEQPTAPRRATTREESNLPNNLPLMPGSVKLHSPNDGGVYDTSELEFLIEGTVPAEATSVWVNGYRLQLFEQGKGFFNYIASVELNTLKRGRNVYDIVVRSADGYILDIVEFVANFSL